MFGLSLLLYWVALFQCMQCDANKGTIPGSPEMFEICRCENHLMIWYLASLLNVVVECWVWKPWTRLRSWCSLASWKISFSLVVPFFLTIVIQIVNTLLLSGVAGFQSYNSQGYIESNYSPNAILFNGVVSTLVMVYQTSQWQKAVDAAVISYENAYLLGEDISESRSLSDDTNRFASMKIVALTRWEKLSNRLESHFGSYIFHFKILAFEVVEIALQMQFMFSMLPLAPYNEWLMVMMWQALTLLATISAVAIKGIRERPWSLKLLYGIEAVSDLAFLYFSLYSLQFLTSRSTVGNIPTLPSSTQFLLKMQIGILHCRSIWDTLSMYLTMARLSYLTNSLLHYVIEEFVHLRGEQVIIETRNQHIIMIGM